MVRISSQSVVNKIDMRFRKKDVVRLVNFLSASSWQRIIPSSRLAVMSSCHHVIMPLRISYRQNNHQNKASLHDPT